MTANSRIALNVIASYGRSLIALACGLFTSRWVLESLGVEAFGVYGVIGVVITIVSLVNGMMSASVSRYYAFAVGKASITQNRAEAVDDCKRWFNVAFMLHFIIPLLFCCGGYFAGDWAIDHYFEIPKRYVATSHYVLYFTLLSTFVNMVTVPFSAMFVAKQLIAEVTVYSLITPVINVTGAWILLSYSGDRLMFHACYTMMMTVIPQLIIIARASRIFPACRLAFPYMRDMRRVKQLVSFAGWQTVGWLGLTAFTQGSSVVVNKYLGISYNSTIGVASSVSGHASALSNSLVGAFSPAVTNATGANQLENAAKLALRACKFSSILCAIFALPLMVEINYVISIWLTTRPPLVELMCIFILADVLIEKLTIGFMTAILARGDIKWHEIGNGSSFVMSLVTCFVLVYFFDVGIIAFGIANVVRGILLCVVREVLWTKQLHLSLNPWLKEFALPYALAVGVSLIVGGLITRAMSASFCRLCLTSVLMGLSFGSIVYLYVFDRDERRALMDRIAQLATRMNLRGAGNT